MQQRLQSNFFFLINFIYFFKNIQKHLRGVSPRSQLEIGHNKNCLLKLFIILFDIILYSIFLHNTLCSVELRLFDLLRQKTKLLSFDFIHVATITELAF